MIVALTDFVSPPYVIPYSTDNQSGVLNFLQLEEKELLQKLLGYSFYKLFEAGMAALPAEWVQGGVYHTGALVVYESDIYQSTHNGSNPHVPSSLNDWVKLPRNKWLKLKKGDNYLNNSRQNTWVGFKEALVPYLHAMYVKRFASFPTGVGVAVPKAENSDVVPPDKMIVRHYNRFVELVGSDQMFGMNSGYLFYEGYLSSLLGEYSEDTLFGYLFNTSTDFDADVVPLGYSDFRSYLGYKYWFPSYMNGFGI